MEQSPSWEANRFSASQEIPHILLDPNVLYRNHQCPPPVPILSQLDPLHTPASYFPKIHLNVILPSTPGSPKWSLSFRFPHQNTVYTSPLLHTRYMPRPPHSSRFYLPNNIGWGVQIFQLLMVQNNNNNNNNNNNKLKCLLSFNLSYKILSLVSLVTLCQHYKLFVA